MTTAINAASRLKASKVTAASTPPNMNMIKAFMNAIISDGNQFKLVRSDETSAVFSAKHLTLDWNGMEFMDKALRHFGDSARVTISCTGGALEVTFLDIGKI